MTNVSSKTKGLEKSQTQVFYKENFPIRSRYLQLITGTKSSQIAIDAKRCPYDLEKPSLLNWGHLKWPVANPCGQ